MTDLRLQTLPSHKKSFAISVSIFSLLLIIAILFFRDDIYRASGYELLQILVYFMPLTGYLGLFFGLLLENTSVPLVAEIFLPLAGYYVFVGRMSFLSVLVVSSIACVLGSVVILALAMKYGVPRIYWIATKVGVSQAMLAKFEIRLCKKRGALLFALSRFVPILGSTIAIPAAATRGNSSSFVALSLLGSLGSAIVYLSLGYVLSPIVLNYQQFLSNIVVRYCLYGLLATCLVYISYFLLRRLKRRRAELAFVRRAELSRSS